MIRRALDSIFAASGAIAVLFLVSIAVLTLAQIAARLLGTLIPSAGDFAGFCMAGAVFLGLTHTLRSGGHVRVLTLLTRVGSGARRIFELMCAGGASLIVATLTWYTIDMIITTRRLGEYTLGLVPVPKWIPMLLMLAGLLVFLLALLDDLLRLVLGEKPVYAAREQDTASSIRASAE